MAHQIHVVHHTIDSHHESWSSPDASVILMRDRGQTVWKAVVGLAVVDDAELQSGLTAIHADAPGDATMRDTSALALAARLARQERIHLVFDKA